MLICKRCKQTFDSVNQFFSHNKTRHPNIVQIQCPYVQCSRLYSNRLSLISHLKNPALHLNEKNSKSNSVPPDRNAPMSSTSLSNEGKQITSKNEYKIKSSENSDESDIISNLKTEMMKHAVSLLSDELISRKKSLEVLKSSFNYYSKAVLSFRGSVENENFKEFCEFFNDTSSVQSEYKLKKALKNAGVFVQSQEHILSNKLSMKYVNTVPKLIRDKRVVKFFNVTEILDKFLNFPGIMKSIVDFVKSKECENESISNIIQSPLWRKLLSVEDMNDSTLYLPLNLFFDDFEPQNVIGSHSGAYKIGSSYMGLPCLPDDMVSKLDFIFPVCQFFSEDRNFYGNQNVFKPVIEMLNELYLTGINVNYGKIRKVRFIVTLILGDNLGLNGILGFTECFVANHYCRFCILKKDVLQKQFFEDFDSLRNYKNYCHGVALGNLSKTGIFEECAFNKLCKFHVIRNFSVDILHDFLEGVCHYDICNIIINLINKKYFTLEELNTNIRYHNYGPFVKNKKIDPITVENLENVHLRTSGSEMQTLVVNLAFIIGHRVDRDCLEWKLYIVLRQILMIVTSKVVHKRAYQLLSTLVSEHHELYLQCFPYDLLKPKHHFMVHYPRTMQMVGPIGPISSMRFESYHKKYKNVANVITCRINLLETFAKKIEYQISNSLLNFKAPDDNKTSRGKLDRVDIKFLRDRYKLPCDTKKIDVTSWVETAGFLIKKGVVIQTSIESDDSPSLALVEDIVITDNSRILLGCKKIDNLGFDSHFHAHAVIEENQYILFPAENVINTSYLFDGKDRKFVCLY